MYDEHPDIHACLTATERAYHADTGPCVTRIERGDTIARITRDANRTILAFRGSDPTLGDWIDDLDFRWSPAAGTPGRVHRGFQRALDRVWRPLLRALAEDSARPLLVTGHSLGGALATLATARLRNRRPVALLCTFGAPRVGDATFVRRLARQPAIRVATPGDPVCEVPPSAFGFRHAGELYLASSSGLIRNPSPPRLVFEVLRAQFDGLAGTGPDAVQSHRLDCYRTRIEQA